MAFTALKKRLERGDISDPHTYIEMYAEAFDQTDDEDDAIGIADHLYNDLPPESSVPSSEDLEQRQVADTLALRNYIDGQTTENYSPDQERGEDGRWTVGGAVAGAAEAVGRAALGKVSEGAHLYAENMGILIHDHPLVKDISWAASDIKDDIPRIAQGIFNRITLGTGPLAIGAVKLGIKIAPAAFHLFAGAIGGMARAGVWAAKKLTGNADSAGASEALRKLDRLVELLNNDPEERRLFEKAIRKIRKKYPKLLEAPAQNEEDEAPDVGLAFGATGGGESFSASSPSVGD